MARKILIGVDDRDESLDAVALGVVLAEALDAGVIVVSAFPGGPVPLGLESMEAYHAAVRKHAEVRFSRVRRMLEGLLLETRIMEGESAPRALDQLAEDEGADLIVLGSTHRGRLGRVLAGSVAERLLHGATCPVAVAPRGYAFTKDRSLRVIAVGFDGQPESKRALGFAEKLALGAEAALRVVCVIEAPGLMGSYTDLVRYLREDHRLLLEDAVAGLPSQVRAEARLLPKESPFTTDPAGALVEDAGTGVDLLVIGSRDYGPLRRVLLGGDAVKVLRQAPCPVLVLPRASEGEHSQERTAEPEPGAEVGNENESTKARGLLLQRPG